MTYKNIKFSESDVMAEFEKIAKTKGLIKEETIVKKASKDLDITNSLDVNISKLIMALAESGEAILANELAKKYSSYKKDDILVKRAEKDKMKELYDSAHDGSVKMDEDPESVVEDLYDVHDKMLEIANRVKLKKKANLIKSAQNYSDYNEQVNEIFLTLRTEINSQLQLVISFSNFTDEERDNKLDLEIKAGAKRFIEYVNFATEGNVIKKTDSIFKSGLAKQLNDAFNKINAIYSNANSSINSKFPEQSKAIGRSIEAAKSKIKALINKSSRRLLTENSDFKKEDIQKYLNLGYQPIYEYDESGVPTKLVKFKYRVKQPKNEFTDREVVQDVFINPDNSLVYLDVNESAKSQSALWSDASIKTIIELIPNLKSTIEIANKKLVEDYDKAKSENDSEDMNWIKNVAFAYLKKLNSDYIQIRNLLDEGHKTDNPGKISQFTGLLIKGKNPTELAASINKAISSVKKEVGI